MKEGILFLIMLAVIILALVIFIILRNIKDYKDYVKSHHAADDIIEMNDDLRVLMLNDENH
ncbi:MAG: FeoB-associated Cys-rich membrane protein [Bacteroidales bacterium]|nr:FeoB-associated Cys-rich membrane protein [Bacteroidales bacterium]